jgi:hypothetical protein
MQKHMMVFTLWTNSMFSGMPTFQIGYTANNKIPWIAHQLFSLGFTKPVNFFFLACICFYFLCVILRVRTVYAILGALAFAYATYDPYYHSSWSRYQNAVNCLYAGITCIDHLIYEKKYWLGAGITPCLLPYLLVQNHPQIDYYLFLTIAIMTIFYVSTLDKK